MWFRLRTKVNPLCPEAEGVGLVTRRTSGLGRAIWYVPSSVYPFVSSYEVHSNPFVVLFMTVGFFCYLFMGQ